MPSAVYASWRARVDIVLIFNVPSYVSGGVRVSNGKQAVSSNFSDPH
jgi:hypothetical protein